MTYLALNATVLLSLLVVLNIFMRRSPWRAIGVTVLVLLVMTAIFDNAIIGAGIVAYDPAKISGVMIWLAPIEDFAYTIAAAVLMPTIWVALERRARK